MCNVAVSTRFSVSDLMYDIGAEPCLSGWWSYFIDHAYVKAYAYCLPCQISEQSTIIFDETMRQDRLPINMNLASEPMLLPAYIEDCRMKLWDHAFNTYFRGSDSFKKR